MVAIYYKIRITLLGVEAFLATLAYVTAFFFFFALKLKLLQISSILAQRQVIM